MQFSWSKIKKRLHQWYSSSPARALDRAYEAALKIKQLEDDYFNGNLISDDGSYGDGTITVLQTQLRNHLNTIRLKLLEYKLSNIAPGNWDTDILSDANNPQSLSFAEKLAVIDQCLARYQLDSSPTIDRGKATVEQSPQLLTKQSILKSRQSYEDRSIIPFSIVETFQQIISFLSPNSTTYEEGIAAELLQVRRRTIAAVRFFVSLFFLAILLQWSSKTFIFSPIVDLFNSPQSVEVKFQNSFKKEALEEFRLVQETLELETLVSELRGIPIDREKQEARLKEEAKKLVLDYNYKSLEGIKNLFADITTGLIIYGIVILGREQITIVKQFLYETLAGLSDSAKAFLIIVSTDTFVGYHSSDGWDALLKVLFAHFGLPESAVLTDTFIATVPVFLDALFKFWIFQYLRRASPPTAAIYREMND
ncbi:MAG: hypothetical protein CV045_07645 [Cyanobacteria bacterium M5B4]|nr:MAG: hypothetical protein CV045_07645 [Cyanobacteria bacterium M5B4]